MKNIIREITVFILIALISTVMAFVIVGLGTIAAVALMKLLQIII